MTSTIADVVSLADGLVGDPADGHPLGIPNGDACY